MDADEVLRDFATTGWRLPVDSMRWAADNWDVAAPRFLNVLERYLTGEDASEDAETQLFFILHLMGQERHKEAFPLLCRLLEDNPAVEAILGDGATETLPGILIGTYDGHRQRLRSIIENPEIDEFLRHAAIETWAYLTFEGTIPHEETRAYLRQLSKSMQAEPESYAWAGITDAIIELGYQDMRHIAQDLIKRGLIDKPVLTMKVFDALMAHSLSDPERQAAFEANHVGPIHSAVKLLSNWASFREPEGEEDDDDSLSNDTPEMQAMFEEPYVNPFRNVGRNDPCPCGSGKKYKKCCLSAAS